MKIVFLSVLFVFLITPIFTALHELGHALIPLMKGEQVKISLGEKSFLNFEVKNLSVEVGVKKPWLGFAVWSGESDVIRLLMGPLASLSLALAFFYFPTDSSTLRSLFLACAGWCLFQFLVTIVPMKYPAFIGYPPGQESDGAQILRILKG